MSNADEVLKAMCQSYSSAVNASDSVTYATLFTQDTIRMPPGAHPEYGPEQIQQGEQADYDVAKWNVTFTPATRCRSPTTGCTASRTSRYLWSPMRMARHPTSG